MAKDGCIFCGSLPVTKEHLFPKWMLKLLRQKFSWKNAKRGFEGASGRQESRTNRPLEMVVKCVCKKCNSGWMSTMEATAQPALTQMLRGESIELDPAMQEAIATWACLKTMVSAYTERIDTIPTDWLTHVYQEGTPPDGWYVYTTRYSGKVGQMAESHRYSLRVAGTDLTLPTSAEEQGVLTCFIIGHLAIQCGGIRKPTGMRGGSNILKLWPPSPLILLWPPALEIRDGRGLDSFRRMGFDAASPVLPPLPPQT